MQQELGLVGNLCLANLSGMNSTHACDSRTGAEAIFLLCVFATQATSLNAHAHIAHQVASSNPTLPLHVNTFVTPW